jgi:pimeloyl-ACP methyl ester carboxylesterase
MTDLRCSAAYSPTYQSKIIVLSFFTPMKLEIYSGSRFQSRYAVWGEDNAKHGTLVLLHGLYENCTVWDGFTAPFASILAQEFRVVAMDLLGHNPDAPIPTNTAVTLRLMADEVMSLLDKIGVGKSIMVGHSMGGAVALQCLKHYSMRCAGLCLFHATPFADSEEMKFNRNKLIESIRNGGKNEAAETLLKRVIPETKWNSMPEDISHLRSLLASTPVSGMIAGHEAMRDREDMQYILNDTPCPTLFLLGKDDPIINIDTMLPLAKLPQNALVSLLHGVAHTGMVESPALCIQVLRGFARFCTTHPYIV